MRQVEEVAAFERPLKSALPLTGKAGLFNNNRQWFGIILCAISGVCYAVQGLLAKVAYANGANVTSTLTIRFTIAALGIWLLVAKLRPPLAQPRSKVSGLTLLGALFVTNSLFFYLALHEMAAGTATLLVFSFPVLVVLWGVIFFKERLGTKRALALIVALVGCMLTIDPVNALASGQNFSWLGAAFAMGSALSNSIYIVLAAKFVKGVPALVAAAWSVPVTAGLYLFWCLVSGDFLFQMPLIAWLCCLAIGGLTAFAVGAYLIGIGAIGSSRAAIVSTTEPATSVFLSVLLLSEPTSLIKLVGGLFIVGAVLLLSARHN